jgi:hypothetical protein
MRPAFVIISLAAPLIVACSQGATKTDPILADACLPAITARPGPDLGGLGVVGDVLSLKLGLPRVCPEGLTVRAIVSVEDPNNVSLPIVDGDTHEVTDRGQNGMTTTIQVHASLPGAYHFTARFEPNVGIAQGEGWVAEDHRDAVPDFIVNGGAGLDDCAHVDVSPGGLLLCLEPGVRIFAADGGLLKTISTDGYASRADDVLWVYDKSAVGRWLEGDGGFTLQPYVPYSSVGFEMTMMLPRRDA